MCNMLMLAKRPQPTDFHTHLLTLAMATLPVQVLSKPHKAAAATKPDMDDPMIEELEPKRTTSLCALGADCKED